MKTYSQVVQKLGENMYSLFMSGSQDYYLWKEMETAAFIFCVPRTQLRQDVENYISKTYKRKL